jgi:hypothetical protein
MIERSVAERVITGQFARYLEDHLGRYEVQSNMTGMA